MENNRNFLMGIITVILVILTACGNSSDESSATLDNQLQNNSLAQNSNEDSTNNASNSGSTNTNAVDSESNGNMDTQNGVPKKEEDSSTISTASLKEEYLQKLNDTKNEVEEMRKNPIDDTTFALKKVEGDAYDILDGLLNEIYEVLKEQLPSDEMDQLRIEQREWIEYRDHNAKEASLKYKGGTMEQYEYVRVENNLTSERCFELVEDYMN